MRLLTAALALLIALPAAAGTLAELLKTRDGQVALHFETRDDVWGDGRSISIGKVDARDHGRWRQGPLHVLIEFIDGEIDDVEARVGEAPRPHRGPLRDLGELSPRSAVDLLLGLAERGRGHDREDLLFPAMLAEDVEVWRRLLAIARDRDADDDLREQAVFWLGQDAAEAASAGLTAILDDDDAELDLREQAIFALSQQDSETSFEALSRVARENPHPQLREQAIFWLAQSDDPRALALFESILLRD